MKRSLLSVDSLSLYDLYEIFHYAGLEDDLFQQEVNCFKTKVMSTFFCEPSMRTLLSFKSAFLKLGGGVINIDASSRQDNIKDIGKTISYYSDIIVVRCLDKNIIYNLNNNSENSVISAGHGKVEHPTTGIGQVCLFHKKYGNLDGFSILIIAKLPKRGVNSLIKCLSKWKNINFHFLTSYKQYLPESIELQLKAMGHNVYYYTSINELLDNGVHIYVNAIFADESNSDFQPDSNKPGHWDIILTSNLMKSFKKDILLTAGFPRTRVIPHELDQQFSDGFIGKSRISFYVRAAILKWALSPS